MIITISVVLSATCAPHLVSARLQPPQLPLRIREILTIKFEVAPLERAHPEAVEMEHAHGDLALRHPGEERIDGRLVVVRRERRREPAPSGCS